MFQKIGDLQCLDVNASNSSESKTVLVLFHGFGADAFDLQTLSDVLATPGLQRFVFPQGFLEVPIGPGWTGRAWWPIRAQVFEDWQKQSLKGEAPDLSAYHPEGLDLARSKAIKMLQALQSQGNQLIVGGFSQGAMLATDVVLNSDLPVQALVGLSGQLICKTEWKEKKDRLKNLPIFMSHGRQDPVLPFSGASRLESFFRDSQAQLRTQFFDGTHEIPPLVIRSLTEFLKGLTESAQ